MGTEITMSNGCFDDELHAKLCTGAVYFITLYNEIIGQFNSLTTFDEYFEIHSHSHSNKDRF